MNDNANRYRVEAVYTAGKILEAVANSRTTLGIADIARDLGITQNMAMRMCSTLEELGHLDKVSDKYRMGTKIALYWARRKSNLEGDRDRVNSELNELEQAGGEQ